MNNQIKVTYLDHMGSDKQVVNAARASFGKESNGPITEADVSLLNFLARGFSQKEWDELASKVLGVESIEEVQELMWQVKTTPTHFAPFTHPQLSIRIEAPLSIARQMWRSHVGLSGGDHGYPGWSEESRRYVDSEPEIFLPDGLRKRADNVKQGSSGELVDNSDELIESLGSHFEQGQQFYQSLLDYGVASEQARLALHNGTMVSWVWTGSLSAWARVAGLRSHGHAQKEAQLIAEPLIEILEAHFPYSYMALATGNAVFKGKFDAYGEYFIGVAELRLGHKLDPYAPYVPEPTSVDKFIDFFKKLFLLP